MTLKYKSQRIVQNVLVDASCDRCNEPLSVDDGKIQDGGTFRHSFSWQNPKYPCGDMVATVCEPCLIEIFHFGTFTKDQY
jgi:hypothetical protein